MSQKPHIFSLALSHALESEMKKQLHVSASENKAHAPSFN